MSVHIAYYTVVKRMIGFRVFYAFKGVIYLIQKRKKGCDCLKMTVGAGGNKLINQNSVVIIHKIVRAITVECADCTVFVWNQELSFRINFIKNLRLKIYV